MTYIYLEGVKFILFRLFFAACFFSLLTSKIYAADITYTGSEALQSKPSWFSYPSSGLLFPGTALMPEGSGNNVTVDFTSGASPNAVIGGLSETSDSLSNTITIKNGTISGRLVGGYVDSGPGSANGNQVIVENGAINGSISGGEAIDGAGSAKGNILTIKAGVTVQNGISGGTAYQGEANNNIVTVTGAALGQSVWGGSSSTGVANENKITITDSSVFAEIYGGSNGVGIASKNEVIVHNSTVTSNHNMGVIGGYASQGNSVENKVSISGASVVKDVFGGRTERGSVIGNKVSISDTANVLGDASGGLVTQGSGDARGNELTMTGGTVAANIAGGKAVKLASDLTNPTGNALDNKLNISGGTANAAAYGGISSLGYTDHNQVIISGTAKLNGGLIGGYSLAGGGYSTYNSITITGGEVVGSLYGGRSDSSYASYNAVTMEGGKAKTIFGAYAPTNNVTNNTVDLTGGTVTSIIYGGFSSTGLATNNAVTISGGTVADITGAYSASNSANTNTLNISKGDVIGNVYGGWSGSGSTANSNKITIGSEATVGASASNNVYGGFNGVGVADANTVIVNGGTVNSILYGGSGKIQANGNTVTATGGSLGSIIGGFSSTGDAKNNHVIINGGTVTGNIFAGYAQTGGAATNNAITISGAANLASSILVGGYKNGGSGDIFSGNTLNVSGFKGSIKGFMNFESINFVFSNPLTNGETILKTLTSGVTNIAGSTINIISPDNPILFQVGNKATLIDASAGTLNGAINAVKTSGVSAEKGIWTYSLSTADNKLDLFVNKLDIDALNATGGYNMAAGNSSSQSVELDVHDQFSTTAFSMTSSASGTAKLDVGGIMTADSFTATKNGAGLAATVDTLDVTGRNTTLTLNDTVAWNGSTGVLFDTIALGGGKTLAVAGNGAFDFNHLQVGGKDAVWDGNLNAGGKQIAFVLGADVRNNDTMLTVTGASGADISGSAISVNFSGDPSFFKVGDRASLLDASVGGLTGTINQQGSYGTSTAQGIWTYSLSNVDDRLDLFVDKLDIDALDAEGTYSVVAGNGQGQWVELDVHDQFNATDFSIASSASGTATLHVDGIMTVDNFTATKNAAGLEATVDTLDVTEHNTTLTLTDTVAWNGSTGVLFDTIVLGGGKTLAVAGNGAFGFNHLSVGGKDAVWDGNLNAGGKQIAFVLGSDVRNNDTMLTVEGASGADISGSAIDISFSDNPLIFQVGNRTSLLDASVGGLTGTINQQGNYGTNTAQGLWTYSLSTVDDRLDLFVNKLDIDALNAAGAYSMEADATGAYSIAAGNGQGQWVELDVHNQLNATDFSIASSASQTASLHVGKTMTINSFTATNNGAGLAATVDTLDVTGRNTTLTLNDTVAWNGSTGVLFDTIVLGGGKTLAVGGNGAFDFNHLQVHGKDAVWDGNLNASGKQMAFVLASDVSNNDTMLTVKGANGANISGAAISVNFSGDPSFFKVGNRASLLDASVGGLTGTINQQGNYGTNTAQGLWTYSLSTVDDRLDLFVNKLDINALNAAGAYGMEAGNGQGQWVELDVRDAFNATDFSIASSASQTASLHVGKTMTVDSFTATNNGAGLAATVDTLDVTGRNTTLTLNDTVAWNGSTGVLFDTIVLGGGKTLAVGGNGAFDFNHLQVHGKDAVWDGNLNASGKQMAFVLGADVSNNDTMLTVKGANGANISGAAISVNFSGDPSFFKVGNRASLLDASVGGLTGTINQQGNYGTNTAQGLWTYSLSTVDDRLDLFVNKLDIDALNAAGAYGMEAGNGQGQWVELDVRDAFNATDFSIASSASQTASLHVGKTMTVDSFTATKNGAGLAATVDILDVTGRNTTLTLNDTVAWNGSTGVLFDTIVLGGGKTLAVAGNGAFDFNHLQVHGKDAVWDGNLNASGKQMAFFLAPDVRNNDTMLTVKGASGADMSGSTVHVGVMGGGAPLKAGDKVVLIDAVAGVSGRPDNASSQAQGMQGISLLYDFMLETTSTQVLAYLASEDVNPQTKALSEGRAAGLSFINQGVELASNQGMLHAVSALGVDDAQWRPVGFGAMGSGESRYNTGSHVDVSGFSLITGLAWGADVSGGRLALAPFFEMGRGDYDSYNSFGAAASVKGGGNTDYYGGGLLGRYDVVGDGAFAGLYTEASVRGGWVDTNFSSNELRDSSGQQAHYDSGAAYWGGHAGLGYVWQVNAQDSLDFSSKYLWTREGGDKVRVANDPIEFGQTDSHRWRNGGRFNHALDLDAGLLSPYIGAAFEYEFDGEASATTYGRPIAAPSLKGGTGIGELGFVYKPVASGDFSVDLGLQGYGGMREGFRGDLQVKYEL